MARAPFGEQIMHVFKIFYMATLVTGEGNTLHILLYGAVNYLIYRSVMAKMYYLRTGALQYATHNIYGSVVPVKKGGGGYKTDLIFRLIGSNAFHLR
jgi:hypothetical protein